MAVETQPEIAPSGRGPAAPRPATPWWMRPGVHTGLIGAVIGYFLGHLLGNFLSSGYAQNSLSDSNDVPIVLGYALAVIGWLAGLGVFNDLLRTTREREHEGGMATPDLFSDFNGIPKGVDKTEFQKTSAPILEKIAKELGPHAVKILGLVRSIK